MPHDPYKALYVHIPFCKSRCNYCDFITSAIDKDDKRIDEYIEQLVLEIRRLAKQGELSQIETLYIGGGTPSHLGISRLSSLLYALSVSADLTREGMEFTLEANPESIDERLVKDCWALGVNRLSIGVQSFDDGILKLLGRAHNADRARTAIALAKERFENFSVDIMCGIPGQADSSLRASLEEAIGAGAPHISVYPLSVEPHTPFDRMVLSGEIDEPDDEDAARHMLLSQEVLENAGYSRYEVASYSKPGFQSKHNTAYWTGVPYLGIGRGATTMTQNSERRMRVQDGRVTDDLDRRQMEAEDLMLGMRLTQGISDDRLERAAAYLPRARAAFEELMDEGLVEHIGGRFRPTQDGWLLGNRIYGRLLDLSQ